MIDIHAHILPGVDDGPEFVEESLEMARLAVARGTTTLFATPHILNEPDLARAWEVAGWVTGLQTLLTAHGIPLTLQPGAEVFPMGSLLSALDDGLPLTLGHGGRYLLLDSSFVMLPPGLEHLVYQLQMRGIIPILAHPERVAPVQEAPGVLERLVHRGLLLQVTAASVTGQFGPQAAQTARTLVRLRWAQFLASDAHSPRTRRPGMQAAWRQIAAWDGEETATRLAQANPRRLLAGEAIPHDPLPYLPEPKRRGWLAWLGRRLAGEVKM